MTEASRREREDTFRADVARLVQAMHHHLPGRDLPPEAAGLAGPVSHLEVLLEADVPAEHLRDAALTVVDAYEWPSPEAGSAGEGPVLDPSILAAVERLRGAIDAMDSEDNDSEDNDSEDNEDSGDKDGTGEPAP